jgi:flagellar basal body P-ring formation protein FlgA
MSTNQHRRFCLSGFGMWHGLLLLLFILVANGVSDGAGGQGIMLTREKMESVLRQHVLQSGPWKPENVEVRIVAFQPVSLPPGQVNFRIIRPVQGVTPGLQSFLVAADIAGREAARLWLRAEIKTFEDVVVTSFPLGNRELVKGADVRLERRDISSLAARPFTRIDDVVGQQAARAVEVNEILTQKSVDRPKLVRRGSSITLVYETGSLRVETPGTAEENGKVGDLIQVKNPTSGKALRGLVLDGRTVRVN